MSHRDELLDALLCERYGPPPLPPAEPPHPVEQALAKRAALEDAAARRHRRRRGHLALLDLYDDQAEPAA